MKKFNPVAKFARRFNKSGAMLDRKRNEKRNIARGKEDLRTIDYGKEERDEK